MQPPPFSLQVQLQEEGKVLQEKKCTMYILFYNNKLYIV